MSSDLVYCNQMSGEHNSHSTICYYYDYPVYQPLSNDDWYNSRIAELEARIATLEYNYAVVSETLSYYQYEICHSREPGYSAKLSTDKIDPPFH